MLCGAAARRAPALLRPAAHAFSVARRPCRRGVIVRSGTPASTALSTAAAPTMADAVEARCFYMGPGTIKIDRLAFHGPLREGLVARMRKALPAEQHGIILLKGGEVQTVYSSDSEVLLRQEAYVHYLWGVNEDGFWGALDVASGRSTLFMPKLPDAYGVWMGPIQGPEHYKAKYAVDEVAYVDDMAAVLKAASPPCLHVLSGTNTDSGTVISPPPFPGSDGFTLEAAALFPAITEARVHKSAGEIALMRYVNHLGSRAHVAMMQACKPGVMEYQMEALFQHYTYSRGGCRFQGYTPIAASGPNGAVLHYGHAGAPNDRRIADGDIVLFDMGCETYRYGSDITCSWPANGKFTPQQALVYDAVLDAHASVIAAMRPGVAWPELHALAYRKILGGLAAGGLLAGDVEDMLAAEVGGLFMPHGLGHLIGIDTHDVGGYADGFPPRIMRPGFKSLRTARLLEPGMIITVEPGCYFNPVLLVPAFEDPAYARFLVKEAIQPFMSFGGVRLEDNVVVTDGGALSLTDVPRTIAEVEAVMAGQAWFGGVPVDEVPNSIEGVPPAPGVSVV